MFTSGRACHLNPNLTSQGTKIKRDDSKSLVSQMKSTVGKENELYNM